MNRLKQPWALTKASYSFSITEDRIFRQILAKMQDLMTFSSKKEVFHDFETEVKVRDILPSENSTNHLAVAQALKKLRERTICFYNDETDDFIFTGIILEARYSRNKQKISLRVSKYLVPHLTFLNKSFTRYSLQVARKCRSPYTVRIYEYLCHMIYGKVPLYNINLLMSSLKLRLGLDENKYKRANSIKQMILLPAQKELKKKADVSFEIKDSIKEGRKVIGWKIKIYKKEKIKGQKETIESSKKLSPKPLVFDYGIMNQPRRGKK